jgi:hypothetical protein
MRTMFIALFAITLFWSQGARAATYLIDLTQPGGVPGTGGAFVAAPCSGSCAVEYPGFQSPLYLFQAGDTVDFGDVNLFPLYSFDSRYGFVSLSALVADVGVSFNQSVTPSSGLAATSSCSYGYFENACSLPSIAAHHASLKFVVPVGANSVQLSWFGPYEYMAPVPEASTWAMLLIGFAGVGLMMYRRRTSRLPARCLT